MTPDERWRAREKARRPAKVKKKPKAKAETLVVSPPPIVIPGFAEALKFKVLDWTFTSPPEHVVDPRQKTKLEQVVEILNEVKLSIGDLSVAARMQPQFYVPNMYQAIVGVRAKVKPLPNTLVLGTLDQNGNIALHGNSGFAVTAEGAVQLARRALIELCAHEIDEWLFKAGLGPDPHKWPDGVVPIEEVGKFP